MVCRPLAVLPTNPAPAHAPDQPPADRGAAHPTGALTIIRVHADALQPGDKLIGIPGMPYRRIVSISARRPDIITAVIDSGLAHFTRQVDTVNALTYVTDGPTLEAARQHPERLHHTLGGFPPIYTPPESL